MTFYASKNSQRPLYEQIKLELHKKIKAGEYPVLGQLPSEYELAELFKVSRITIRQALHHLSQQGVIFKIPGKGTFVSKPKAHQDITQLRGFAETMSIDGHQILNEVLSIDFIDVPLEVSVKLNLPVKHQVAEIKRIRLLNNEPISYELTYLKKELVEEILAKNIDLATNDIFTVIENDLAIPLGYADLNIEAIQANNEIAEHLSVDINTPILRVERLTYDQNNVPLDYEYLYFSGESFKYQLRIFRSTSLREKQ